MVVCESSKQIGQTNGSGCLGAGGGRPVSGDSARLDLEEHVFDSAVDRRVARRMPLERARALDEDVLERIGAGGDGVDGSGGRMPADVVTWDALSMYFSMRRSLFQFMYRSSSEAALAYNEKFNTHEEIQVGRK